MPQTDWWNRTRYRLYAPVYDLAARPFDRGRRLAVDRLDLHAGDRVLVVGCGTGRDLAYLPDDVAVTVTDLVPAMVDRAAARSRRLDADADAVVCDAHSLPFDDDAFDAVLLHLVLSVVPDPTAVVAETERVLRADGRASIYDKFVPPDETPSLPRRLANPLARLAFADLNRSLEPMVADTTLSLTPPESVLGIYSVRTAHPTGTD